MPKLKTHRGTAKRTRRTKSGKLLRRRANSNHNFGKKSGAQKRSYAKNYTVSGKEKKNLQTKLGNQ